ncbi:MAG: hypothetical protein CL489_03285 [Acidobacteria bacterium]|nr:hypothetical protein [Acidobacteriota bacterium]|tara:strand:- start:1584 stop:1784 length:201 start_codon:yes stop_codon:yes gene_type:complete
MESFGNRVFDKEDIGSMRLCKKCGIFFSRFNGLEFTPDASVSIDALFEVRESNCEPCIDALSASLR